MDVGLSNRSLTLELSRTVDRESKERTEMICLIVIIVSHSRRGIVEFEIITDCRSYNSLRYLAHDNEHRMQGDCKHRQSGKQTGRR